VGLSSKGTVVQSRSIGRVIAPPEEQIFQPTGASLVIQGGRPVVGAAYSRPTGAQLVVKGGTPIIGGINARPTGASLVLSGGTPTVWDFTAIPNLVSWYDPVQETAYADNDPVTTATDFFGANDAAVGEDATARPLYKTAIKNGLPVFRYDGTNDRLHASFTLNQPCWMATAFQMRGAVTSNKEVWDGFTGASTIGGVTLDAGIFRLYAGVGSGFSIGTIVADTWYVVIGVFNGASSVGYFNGTPTSGNAGTGNPGGISMGARVNGATPAPCDTGDFLVGTGVPGAATITELTAALRLKWAI